jgi:hypothetical protein
VGNANQHSSKLTAVIAITAAGKKLSIFFIIIGKQGGCIAKNELKLYPYLHYYICQKNAWKLGIFI